MNENHAQLCGSPEWAEYLHTEVLPGLVAQVEVGEHLLEVGPGPGASTEWLRSLVSRLTVVETDGEAAEKLAARYAGTNVEVIHGDATELTFAQDSFDSAGSSTMLHHVPTVALQNKLLAEVLRVLKPGGALIGSDSLPSDALHQFHEGDTYNPVDPGGLYGRLETLGYHRITVSGDGT